MTSLRAVSTPDTSASITVVLRWPPMMPRIGDAISAGERPAVAT